MPRLRSLPLFLLLVMLASAVWPVHGTPALAEFLTAPIQNLAFPFQVTVSTGSTLIWVNQEPVIPHDVVSGAPGRRDAGQAFTSPMLQPGQSFNFTFGQPGSYDYYCSLHPNMRGTVVVKDEEPIKEPFIEGGNAEDGNAMEGDAQRAASAGLASAIIRESPARAQVSTPAANVTVAAGGLLNPRGFTFGPDGTLVVAESGSTPPGFEPAGFPPPEDFQPGTSRTGRISRFNLASGERTTVADGLPSSAGFTGDTLGPTSVAYLGNDLYVAMVAGPVHGWPYFPSGVYRVNPDGTIRLVGNTDAFNLRNPVSLVAPDEEISNPYDMVAGDGALWVTDGNVNQVYRIAPGAPVTRFTDLSGDHPVTTGVARAPGGGLIAVELTAVPFVESAGRILRIGAEGQAETLFRGTTAATGVAVTADGTIYVVEHSISLGRPFLEPSSGRVARLTAEGTLETVAGGLMFPTMARIGPDGALYVSSFSVGGDNGEGQILRVDLGAGR